MDQVQGQLDKDSPEQLGGRGFSGGTTKDQNRTNDKQTGQDRQNPSQTQLSKRQTNPTNGQCQTLDGWTQADLARRPGVTLLDICLDPPTAHRLNLDPLDLGRQDIWTRAKQKDRTHKRTKPKPVHSWNKVSRSFARSVFMSRANQMNKTRTQADGPRQPQAQPQLQTEGHASRRMAALTRRQQPVGFGQPTLVGQNPRPRPRTEPNPGHGMLMGSNQEQQTKQTDKQTTNNGPNCKQTKTINKQTDKQARQPDTRYRLYTNHNNLVTP